MLCYLALWENICAWKHLAEKRESVTKPNLERWYNTVVGVEPALVLHPETGVSLRQLTMLMRWRTPDLTGEEASENLSAAIWRVARESIKPEKFPPSLRDDPEKAPMNRRGTWLCAPVYCSACFFLMDVASADHVHAAACIPDA